MKVLTKPTKACITERAFANEQHTRRSSTYVNGAAILSSRFAPILLYNPSPPPSVSSLLIFSLYNPVHKNNQYQSPLHFSHFELVAHISLLAQSECNTFFQSQDLPLNPSQVTASHCTCGLAFIMGIDYNSHPTELVVGGVSGHCSIPCP